MNLFSVNRSARTALAALKPRGKPETNRKFRKRTPIELRKFPVKACICGPGEVSPGTTRSDRRIEEPAAAMTLRPFLLAFFALSLLPAPGSAAARGIRIDYAVSIRGFPVGRAELRAEIAERRYHIAFSARVAGLLRLFSDAHTTAEATGVLGDDRPRPEDYSHIWVEDDEAETVTMRFAGDGVADIRLDPPRGRPERYVPMTAAHKANAVDLASAALWPTPDGVSPTTCNRTLPLIDGKRRFDVGFAFVRMESFATENGSRHRKAVVCSIDYRPISGHRRTGDEGGFLRPDGNMEVWLAALGEGIAMPVKVELSSRAGRVTLDATKLEVD